MQALWLKLKADIVKRPLHALLLTITVAAASTLLTLALATLSNITSPYDQTFADLNGAHLWLHFNRSRLRSRDIARIEALPGVVESTGLRYSVLSQAHLPETRVWVSLRVVPDDPPPVNRLFIQDGRSLGARQPELLASKDLNDIYQLAVGETVEIEGADRKLVELPVTGLAYNPMWDIYRNTQPPYIYLTEDTLHQLYPDPGMWDWSIGLRLADPQAVDDVVTQIEALLRSDAIADHTDWRDVRESAIFGAQLNFILLSAFSLFAILAVILVITSSISATILSQFKQIGMLKAIGFTQAQILGLYLGQYLALGLLGSLLGLVLGLVLSPLPLRNVAASLNATFRPPINLALIMTVLGGISGVLFLATLGAAYKGSKTNIIKAIATGAEAPAKGHRWRAISNFSFALPVSLTLGSSDIFTRPMRTLITGLNLTLGVIGIVFGLILNNTIDTYAANPALLGFVYDATVTRQEASHNRTRHLLQTAPGVEAFYGERQLEVETPTGQAFNVKAVDGDLAPFPFVLPEGRLLKPNTYEAMAGRGLLDWLGLEVGDSLTVLIDEQPITWHIVGQYPEPANAGQMLMVNLDSLSDKIKPAKPSTYQLKLNSSANIPYLKQYFSPNKNSDLVFTLAGQAIPDSVIYLQLGIFGLAAILIGMALINVFNSSLLAIQEKLRAIGILKTLGMTPRQIVTMVNTSAGVLGFCATLVGIPVGWVLTKGALGLYSQSYGFGAVQTSLSLMHMLLLFPLIIGLSIGGSYLPSRRAAKAAIVEVLRHE